MLSDYCRSPSWSLGAIRYGFHSPWLRAPLTNKARCLVQTRFWLDGVLQSPSQYGNPGFVGAWTTGVSVCDDRSTYEVNAMIDEFMMFASPMSDAGRSV